MELLKLYITISYMLFAFMINKAINNYGQLYYICMWILYGKINLVIAANFCMANIVIASCIVKAMLFPTLRAGELDKIWLRTKQYGYSFMLLYLFSTQNGRVEPLYFIACALCFYILNVFHWIVLMKSHYVYCSADYIQPAVRQVDQLQANILLFNEHIHRIPAYEIAGVH